jgi:hypothetical protein
MRSMGERREAGGVQYVLFGGREVNRTDTFSPPRALNTNKKRCIRTKRKILRYLLYILMFL